MRQLPVVGVVLLVGLTGVAAAQCDWHWVNPVPPRANLMAMAVAPNRFVAVGERGVIVTTEEGAEWQVAESPTDRDLYAAIRAEGLFVAGGDRVILSSQLGMSWTVAWHADAGVVRDLAWGDGRFMAVGSELPGHVLISDDGAAWQQQAVPWSGDAEAVIRLDGEFLVAAEAGVWASDDGLQWHLAQTLPSTPFAAKNAPAPTASHSLMGLARHDFASDGTTLFWFDGLDLWARDAESGWNNVMRADGCEPASAIDAVWAADGVVLAAAHGGCPNPYLDLTTTISQSVDHGTNWSILLQDYGGGLGGLARWSTRTIAVGAGGDVAIRVGGVPWSWLEAASSSAACSDAFLDLDVLDGQLAAVGGVGLCSAQAKRLGGGTLATSPGDGTWQVRETAGPRLLRLTRSDDLMVGVGENWLYTSTDGIEWQQQSLPDNMVVKDVVAHDGTFFAVGLGGKVGNSVDGVDWDVISIPPIGDLWWIGYLARRLIAVGAGGTIITSFDDLNWSVERANVSRVLRAAAFGANRFVAVGDQGTVLISDDGTSWLRRITDVAESETLLDVAYGHGRFVAVGSRQLSARDTRGVLIASVDGDSWTRIDPSSAGLHRVVALDEGWLVAGDDRTLLAADCLGTLLAIEPTVVRIARDQAVDLRVELDVAADQEVALTVALDPPGVVAAPSLVRVPAGAVEVTVAVVGAVAGTATLRVVAPDELGGGSVTAAIEVGDAPWTRRATGRVGP